MNKIFLLGRITNDLELKEGKSNYLQFSIAVNREYKNEAGQYEADFINCTAFGKTAEIISKYFQKGSKILVEGRLQQNRYTDTEGNNKSSYNVVVDKIQFIENKQNNQENVQKEETDPFEEFSEIVEEQATIDDYLD